MRKNYILITMLALTSCNINKTKVDLTNIQSTIFVASDLHFLSNNLISDTNTTITKGKLTNDGRIQELDYEIVNGLVDCVNKAKPKALVITGDLTFNGEKASHEDLANILNNVNPDTKVLVIPGNHDCYNISSKSYLNDKKEPTLNIDSNIFKNIYANFGYSDAYSYDENTLSYAYKIDDKNVLLMLDTTLSIYNYELDSNIVGGALDTSTLNWIESILIEAKNNNWNVISFSHHNLLTHNPLFNNMYTLSNSSDLLDLYNKYDVRLNMSGHLHIQNIACNDSFCDIASGGILDYGNRYGIINIYDDYFEYKSNKIVLENMDLQKLSYDCFYSKYYNKSLKKFDSYYGTTYGSQINDLLSSVNCYYFDGNYKKIIDLKKKNKKLVQKILENEKDEYGKSIMNVDNVNQDYKLIKIH